MNGAQDLGGMMGFGRIAPEATEPLFHAGWEARALAITIAAGALGRWTIDRSRFTRESLPPAVYLSATYYEIWISALQTLLAQESLVLPDEIAAGHALRTGPALAALPAARVPAMLAKGTPCDRPLPVPARFAVGDAVRTINAHPPTHTRLPRYARDKRGIVSAVRGGFVYPDTNAHGAG